MGIWHKWKKIASKIATFNTKIILTLFYFIFLLPVAIPFRIANDTLKIKKKNKELWWFNKREPNLSNLSKQS